MVIECIKRQGETPLEALERVRKEKGIEVDVPMTYAGRLDPMAEGLLLILVGDECKNKEKYLGLDKEYEVEVLFGFETDTYDILGKVEKVSEGKIHFDDVFLTLQSFVGKFTQEYPRYSSKVFASVTLSAIANNVALDEPLPTKEVEIYSINYLDMWEKSGGEILSEIQSRIAKVKGDFRQAEILELWQKSLESDALYQILKIKVACSSGTYMRTLAHELGRKLGTPAIAYGIRRVKII